MREEASHIYYGNNKFSLSPALVCFDFEAHPNVEALVRWLTGNGPEQRTMIRHMRAVGGFVWAREVTEVEEARKACRQRLCDAGVALGEGVLSIE